MKAMVVSPVGGRVPPTRGVLHNGLGLNGGSGGGVGGGVGGGGGGGGSRRDMEAEEVTAYLTKLRSLVPDMPRKRKLSKLEVIQRVIEYICDLQTTLEETNVQPNEKTNSNSNSNSPSPSSPVHNNFNIQQQQQQQQQQQRQPLQPLLNSTAIAANATATGSIAMITSTTTMSTTTTTTISTTNDGSSVSYQR